MLWQFLVRVNNTPSTGSRHDHRSSLVRGCQFLARWDCGVGEADPNCGANQTKGPGSWAVHHRSSILDAFGFLWRVYASQSPKAINHSQVGFMKLGVTGTLYDLCYQLPNYYTLLTLPYIFSWVVDGVVGYVEKTCYYDFTQDKHDKLYRTPPKR